MRGKQAKKRRIEPDQKYSSKSIAKLINKVMKGGKKRIAMKIVYDALTEAEKKMNKDPLEVYSKAMDNVKPKLEIRSRRVGGANYQVPVPVSEERQEMLAMRWIINAARESRGDKEFYVALSDELINAYKGTGVAIKKKEDTEKMAEANKAFAHFQW